MSRFELPRRAYHAMSTQSFTIHSLKRLKLLAILGSVLILWAGFTLQAQAVTRYYVMMTGGHLTVAGGWTSYSELIEYDGSDELWAAYNSLWNASGWEGHVLELRPGSCLFESIPGVIPGKPYGKFYTGCTATLHYASPHYRTKTCSTPTEYADVYPGTSTIYCTDVAPNPPPPECPEGEEYNPDTQQCEASPLPPPPPEKNLGGCSEGPSPYVADMK